MSDNLVPEPRNTVFDSVQKALGDEQAARRVMLNPALAKGLSGTGLQQEDTLPRPQRNTPASAAGRMPRRPPTTAASR